MTPKRVSSPRVDHRKGPVRIVIVDDHVFMRDLMSGTLARKSARYKVLASVGTAAAAIAACREFAPDLLILDINLPDQSGIDAVPEIKRIAPKTRILLCTAFATEDRIVDSLRAGAHGFVEKTHTWDDFLVAVDRVGSGQPYFCSQSGGTFQPQEPKRQTQVPGAILSPRERQVIRLIAQGRTSKEIASLLSISVATVETHRTNLMSKLGVHNVAALVLYAVKHGLADADGA